MPDNTSPPNPAPRRHRLLVLVAATLLALVLILAALIFAAVETEWGTRTLWQITTRALGGKLSGEFVGGTLGDGIRLRNVAYRDDQRVVAIDQVVGAWHLTLSPFALTVKFLRIGNADVTLLPSPSTPMTLPRQITLPLSIDLQSATVRKLIIHKDGTASTYSDIAIRASSDRVHHALTLENAVTPYGTAHAALRLDGTPPFSINGSADLAGAWQEQRYRLETRVSGTLEALEVRLDAAGDKLAGHAHIEATPFAAIPFRRVLIELDHVNPRLFSAAAPQADLKLHANLAPLAVQTGDLSQLAVSGPVSIANAEPGPIDQDRLPLISTNANVTLDMQRQQLSGLNVRLAGNATLKGGADIRNGAGRLTLQADRLDLRALYTKLKSTQLAGPITVDLDDGTQRLTLKLTDPSLSAEADAELNAREIKLRAAQLQSGPARLKLGGTLTRDARSAYTVQGELADFNPGLFGAKSAGQPIDARINMNFSAQGALHPELSTKVRFDIHDSSYDKLPMTGGGTLNLAGKRLLPSDAQVSIAGNEVAVKGAFGAPGERLNFKIDAPALDRLGLGLAGLLQAEGQLGGTMKRPTVEAEYRARQLVLGDNRLAQLEGNARIEGVPGANPDARVALKLAAQGLQSADIINLDKLNADISGTYASHTIDIESSGRLRGKPLALRLAAQGRLREQQQGLAWDGSLRTLENRGMPRFAIEAPLAVAVAPGRLELGATRLTVEQAIVDLKSLQYDDGRIRSEGGFSALNIGQLLELQREFTGTSAPIKTDLVLDGRWNLALTDTASGFLQIERQRGDIVIITQYGESTLGLSDLALRADLQGRQVHLDAKIKAERVGNIGMQGQIGLLQEDGRLTLGPDAPIDVRAAVTVPRLRDIGTLAGPRIALDGTIAGNVTAAGTLGDPRLSGTINGDRLALTLFDQGVRLRDGTAHIALTDNVVELREVVFHGGDGTVRATGRIPLDQENPDLTARIVADRLQLLADPSTQLTLSGEASGANINRQLQIAGKFTVDHAQISLPEKAAPKLGDDVVILDKNGKPIQQRTPASAKTASPLSPRVNVEIDLGKDFHFKGSGADLQLAGALTVRSEPGQAPQAFGAVRVTQGAYEAFGAKLAIEHGVINFRGSFDNPSLNILAMRREQEVAAGVQVTGTVQQPRVALVSEPDVSDEEKLSWLVFGRGGGSTEPGQAQSAAKDAALGVLNSFGGARLAKGLGLDKLSIGSSEFGLANQQVVSLGKEISNRLYVGYEQSLSGTGSVVKLTYELTRYWSVVVRGGAIAGMEMLYNKRFDNFAGRSREKAAEK